ncbi:MAG: UTRA domain-containing protein [Caulobacteraceae bacterium]|nr:UTRA domain-containing protein [Caulobacteraceae bacterium]
MAAARAQTAWWTQPAALGDQPHYLSIRDHIVRRIQSGDLPAGAKLPSERQLQTGAGIARGTIREALFQLEAEGQIYRRDRSGWYVSPAPIIYDPTRWAGFMTYVSEQGRIPATTTLVAELAPAPPAAAEVFGVEVGAPLYALRRRRSIDGRPVLIEDIQVSPALAPGLLRFPLDGSLTQILKREYGVSVARNRVDMWPCALTKAEASALAAKPGTPGLVVVRTSFDAAGRVVEYDREYWRHDAMRIHVDTRVPPNAGDDAQPPSAARPRP